MWTPGTGRMPQGLTTPSVSAVMVEQAEQLSDPKTRLDSHICRRSYYTYTGVGSGHMNAGAVVFRDRSNLRNLYTGSGAM
jgi:hypothetical protein